jgi:hypothetical protein
MVMRRALVALLAGSLMVISMAGAAAAFTPPNQTPWTLSGGRGEPCTTGSGAFGMIWVHDVSGAEVCWPI